ncbi:MFS transporter [Variovorax sp. JS1663]|uniref:MFS transporter n=1 Tax=Variovorax sp. JS1663 TaxID=1851577 RepID=UPI000B343FE5|nr:MFS transporter [Variovorax sp. JS1663]OUM00324.1 permease [Variovorax sp. JS1663]
MFEKAYAAQCAACENCAKAELARRRHNLALFSLALGTFCIGTSEFASMGILQLFSASFGVGIPTATHAITAYAVGVVIGGPVVTLAAARMNRRTLLLALIGLFVAGNLLSAMAPTLEAMAAARFVSGIPQGAYFGAGAVVASHFVGKGQGGKAFALVMTGLTIATIFGSPLATLLGQQLGWRQTYVAVAAAGGLSWLALWAWVPRTDELRGGPVGQELVALGRRSVWAMMVVAALGVASIFAVYTFIGPLVTDVNRLSASTVPIALGIFGIGMTVGNLIGGRLADRFESLGLFCGFGLALIVLAVLGWQGENPWVLMGALFGVGAAIMAAIPTIQVRLTAFAPEAPTLMGAMNLAALNVANALGAWAGSLVIASHGLLSCVWAGFALTLAGLLAYVITVGRSARPDRGYRAMTAPQ